MTKHIDSDLGVEIEIKEEPFEGNGFQDTLVEDTMAMSKSDILEVLRKVSETHEFRPTGDGMELVSSHSYEFDNQAMASLPIDQLRNLLTQTKSREDKKLIKSIIKEKKKAGRF